MRRRRAAIAAGLLLSVALLWWALRDVSPAELWARVRGANPWLLAAMTAAATGSFALRAIRWRLLLVPALPHSTFRSRFSAVCIGFMGNNLLPLRLGEFARIYAFARTERIGMSATLASLVVERLFDGLMLVLLLSLALATPELVEHAPAWAAHASAVGAVAVVLGLVLLWLVVVFPERLLGFVRRAILDRLPERFGARGFRILSSFITGLGALGRPWIFTRALFWSAIIWLWNGASFWLGFLAFGIEAPGFAGALFLQSLIALAVSLPSAPGFFGPFEAAARVALTVYAVEPSLLMAYATGYHILTFIPVTLMGLWYANRLGISWSEVEHSEEYVEAAVEADEKGLPAERESGGGPPGSGGEGGSAEAGLERARDGHAG